MKFFIFLLSFLMIGALGLKHPEECYESTLPSKQMQCLHTAAISAAYLGAEGEASSICSSIFNDYANLERESDDDLKRRAELMHNTCYYDIATILRNPDLCAPIQKKTGFAQQIGLSGNEVTQDQCYKHVEKLARIAPEYYFQNNPNSLCSIVFVLPLFVLFILKRYP